MQFNSYIFILAYLPILIIGYFLLNKVSMHIGKVYLIAGSVFFYIYGGLDMALVFGLSIITNFTMSQLLNKLVKARKPIFILAVIANAGLLFYYKYNNFFIENVNSAFKTDFRMNSIILPLGISFFTFQQIAYVASVYKNEIGNINIIDYLAYITYFPKLLMGPLIEPTDFMAQLNDSRLKLCHANHSTHGHSVLKTSKCGAQKEDTEKSVSSGKQFAPPSGILYNQHK